MIKIAREKIRKSPGKGMSVVEIIVVVALVGIISVILMDIFIAHGRMFNLGTANSDFELQGAETMEAVGKIIRVADKSLSSKTINSANYTASSGVMILEMPSINASGLVIAGTYDYAAIYLSGGKIFVSEEAAPGSSRHSSTRALSDSVSRLQFVPDSGTYDNVSSVIVQVTLSKIISGKTQALNLDKKFNLENK